VKTLAALLAVLVVASGCGENDDGGDDQPGNPTGQACLLRIRGAVTEDLSCVVTAIDSSAGNPLSTHWEFELVAYRGTTEIGATANFVREGRPSLDTVYGWTASTSNVFTGVAERTVPDPTGDSGAHVDTHQALYALEPWGRSRQPLRKSRRPTPLGPGCSTSTEHSRRRSRRSTA
jgi:hypothetical protein